MKAFLAIVFAPAALYLVVSNTHESWHGSAGASGPPASARDVERVTSVAHRGQLDIALKRVYVTIGGKRAWTQERAVRIRHALPPLARRVAELSDGARARVAAVDVHTATGRRFRAVLADGLQRQGLVYRRLSHDLATSHSSLRALRRWENRLQVLRHRYAMQVQSIVDAAPPEERAAVDAAAY
jgi:hypothetical protein